MTRYLKAAHGGNAKAQHFLGVKYDKGLGIRHDYAEAARWYRRAAEQGNANAQHDLGTLYGDGLGVPQDAVEAYKWLSLAAAQFNVLNAPEYRALALKNRAELAVNMTASQRATALQLALEWQPTTLPDWQIDLGIRYLARRTERATVDVAVARERQVQRAVN